MYRAFGTFTYQGPPAQQQQQQQQAQAQQQQRQGNGHEAALYHESQEKHNAQMQPQMAQPPQQQPLQNNFGVAPSYAEQAEEKRQGEPLQAMPNGRKSDEELKRIVRQKLEGAAAAQGKRDKSPKVSQSAIRDIVKSLERKSAQQENAKQKKDKKKRVTGEHKTTRNPRLN